METTTTERGTTRGRGRHGHASAPRGIHDTLGITRGRFLVEGAVEEREGALKAEVLPYSSGSLLLGQGVAGDEAGELKEWFVRGAAEGGTADDGVNGDGAGGSAVRPGLKEGGEQNPPTSSPRMHTLRFPQGFASEPPFRPSHTTAACGLLIRTLAAERGLFGGARRVQGYEGWLQSCMSHGQLSGAF